MKPNPLQTVIRHLRDRAAAAKTAACVDAELLTRFARNGDEAAFEELVRRHGPLVWAVCRSGLQSADAEDAFQATFIILARRAASIRKPASVACWLSGVARKVVRGARRRAARTRTGRLPETLPAREPSAVDREWLAWREVLDEELCRLPEKYRLPVVLCYYQGLTNQEAAARLGWPVGTVAGRLARAREQLRRRLRGRGFTLGAGAWPIGAAGLPTDLLALTLRMCDRAINQSGGSLAGPVLQMAEAVMHTIWLRNVKMWVIGAAAVTALAGGVAGWTLMPTNAQAPAAPQQAAREAPPALPLPPANPTQADFDRFLTEAAKPSPLAAPSPTDDELLKLKKERYQHALTELKWRLEGFAAGTTTSNLDALTACVSNRLLNAELALSDRPGDRVAVYSRAVAVWKWAEWVNETRFNAGRIATQDLEQTRVERLTMEIKLLEAKRAAEAKPR